MLLISVCIVWQISYTSALIAWLNIDSGLNINAVHWSSVWLLPPYYCKVLYNFSLNPSQRVQNRLNIEDLTHLTWFYITVHKHSLRDGACPANLFPTWDGDYYYYVFFGYWVEEDEIKDLGKEGVCKGLLQTSLPPLFNLIPWLDS